MFLQKDVNRFIQAARDGIPDTLLTISLRR